MSMSLKCENCGGTMNLDSDHPIAVCPFCGQAIKYDETKYDFARYKMKFNEQVRQNKIKEKQKDSKWDTIETIVVVILLLCACLYLHFREDDPKYSLPARVQLVQKLIDQGDYDKALIEAQSIRKEKNGLFDTSYKQWDQQRNDLIKLIEKLKKEANKK